MLDLLEIVKTADTLTEAELAAARKVVIESAAKVNAVSAADLELAAKMYGSFRKTAEKYQLSTYAVRCWPEFSDLFGIAPCAVLGMLSDTGFATSCEGDVTGAFTMKLLQALAGGGIPVSVITTLHSKNAPLLPELYAVLREKPLFAWQIQACSPMGNAALSGIDWRFDFGRVLRFVRETKYSAPFLIGVADNIGYFSPDDAALRGGTRRFSGCGAGLRSLGIDSAGNVRGCESMYDERFIEGNLRERRLADIWNDPDAFAYNRRFTPALLTGACASCPYGSRCAAGCRSYDYFTTGKLYESPLCVSRGG